MRLRLQNRILPFKQSARFETKNASDRALCFYVRKMQNYAISCSFLRYCVSLQKSRKERRMQLFITHARYEPRTAHTGRFAYLCEIRQSPSKIVTFKKSCTHYRRVTASWTISLRSSMRITYPAKSLMTVLPECPRNMRKNRQRLQRNLKPRKQLWINPTASL